MPTNPDRDLRTPFARLGLLLAIGLVGAVLIAFATSDGLGIFTLEQAFVGLGVAVLVVGIVLLALMFTVGNILNELKALRSETDRLRAAIAGTEGDHVLTIEGIGSKYASRLNAAGIITIPQLIEADATHVASAVGATVPLVEEWQAMGRFTRLRGIGPQYAEAIVRAGLRTVYDLAHTDADALAATIKRMAEGRAIRLNGADIGAGTTARWIQAAKQSLNEGLVNLRKA